MIDLTNEEIGLLKEAISERILFYDRLGSSFFDKWFKDDKTREHTLEQIKETQQKYGYLLAKMSGAIHT